MKSMIVFSLFVVILSSLYCKSSCYATDEEKFRFYRTSSPVTNNGNNLTQVVITSSPTFIYQVLVTSGATASGFRFFNSSSVAVIQSTSPYYDCSSSQNKWEIRRPLSRGLMISISSGIAAPSIQIDYDFLHNIPAGQENLGYMP